MLRSLSRLLEWIWVRRPKVATTARRPAMCVEALEDRWMPSTISGTVYLDLNHNGLLDPGETGIHGSTVELHAASDGRLIDRQVSDSAGHYAFVNDPTQPKVVNTKTLDANFAMTPTDHDRSADLAQFDPGLGTLKSVDIVFDGALTSHVKVESLDAASSQVGATVNGTLDLKLGSMPPLESRLTLDSGPTTLSAFDNTIDFGGTSGKDFGDQNSNDSKTETFVAGTDDLTAFIGTGTIHVSETAQAATAVNGPGNVVAQINTLAGGHARIVYHYESEAPLETGNYFVSEPVPPAGYLPGQDTADNITPLTNMPPGQNIIPVTLTNNDSPNNNFGNLAPASLSGEVFHDVNGNGVNEGQTVEAGIGGVGVALTGTDYLGHAVSLTATTDGGGNYAFTGLLPGTYALTSGQPAGFTYERANPGSQGAVAGDHVLGQINLNVAVDGVHNDFAQVVPASLSGTVYHDVNDNAVLNPGEPGIGGVGVGLLGTDNLGNAVNLSTVTDGAGAYTFANLRPGVYTIVQLNQPAGYLDGRDAIGTQGGATSVNMLTGISLLSGVNGTQNNFSQVLPASVSGFVYVDQANNGQRTPTDPGVPGVEVTLTGTDDFGQTITQRTSTDGNGAYLFPNLRPGTYVVTKTDPAGYLKGQDTTGSLGGSVAPDQLGVVLGSGSTGVNYNFGELLPSTPIGTPLIPGNTPAVTPQPVTPPPATEPTDFSKLFFIGNNWLT